MSANSRLTIAVHCLTWLALAHKRGREVLTSEQIAASINTNPVVVRRGLAQLSRAGLVTVRHGSGAGWKLALPPERISLLHVYEAVETGPLFGMHRHEPNLECPVGFGIRPVLGGIYSEMEQAIRRHLSGTSIAEVLDEVMAVSK